jgi:glucosylceramidase
VPIVLDDPEARKFISSISYHGYDAFFRDGTLPPNMAADKTEKLFRYDTPTAENGYDFSEFSYVKELHEQYPTMPLWMTEVCYFDYNANAGLPSTHPPIPRYEFDDGDFWGQQIFSDIEAGASGWTYWNMILDEKGGPWLVSPEHGDGEYNSQHPVVIIDRKIKRAYFTGLYYYLAHFSKFVRPASVRFEVIGSEKGVRSLAFQRPDGKRVVELINSNLSNQKISLQWHDKILDITLKARSITTLVW